MFRLSRLVILEIISREGNNLIKSKFNWINTIKKTTRPDQGKEEWVKNTTAIFPTDQNYRRIPIYFY